MTTVHQWTRTRHAYSHDLAVRSGRRASPPPGYSSKQVIEAQAYDAASEKFFGAFGNWYGSSYGCRACPGMLHKIVFPEGGEFELLTDDPANPRVAAKRLFTCAHCKRFVTSAASEDDVANAVGGAVREGGVSSVAAFTSGNLSDPNNFEFECHSMTEYRELLQMANAIGTTVGRQDAGFIRITGGDSDALWVNPIPATRETFDPADWQEDPLGVREEVATRLLAWGCELAHPLGRYEEAAAAFDVVIATYGRDEAPAVRECVVQALDLKGTALSNLGRPEEAIAVFDEVFAKYGRDEASEIRATVASSLVSKSAALIKLGRLEDVSAALNNVVASYGRDEALEVREQAALALGLRSNVLCDLGRFEEAARAADEVVARYGRDGTPGSRAAVEMAQHTTAVVRARGNETPRQYGIQPAAPVKTKQEGCYIATAVYGSYDAPEVVTLRQFRDTKLAVTPTGRGLIRIYYKASPHLAKRFTDSAPLTGVARRWLDTFVEYLERQPPG